MRTRLVVAKHLPNLLWTVYDRSSFAPSGPTRRLIAQQFRRQPGAVLSRAALLVYSAASSSLRAWLAQRARQSRSLGGWHSDPNARVAIRDLGFVEPAE